MSAPAGTAGQAVLDDERADGGVGCVAVGRTETIAGSIRFWSSEDAILGQLYGVVAADAAARDLVERQREDRRGEMKRLAKHLRQSGRLPADTSEARALSLLMVLTSYETFRELRQADLSEGELTRTLQETGRALLLSGR